MYKSRYYDRHLRQWLVDRIDTNAIETVDDEPLGWLGHFETYDEAYAYSRNHDFSYIEPFFAFVESMDTIVWF